MSKPSFGLNIVNHTLIRKVRSKHRLRFLHWLIEPEADVTEANGTSVLAIRDKIKINSLVQESYRRVGVAEPVNGLASTGQVVDRFSRSVDPQGLVYLIVDQN